MAFPISAILQLLSSPDCSLSAWDDLGWASRPIASLLSVGFMSDFIWKMPAAVEGVELAETQGLQGKGLKRTKSWVKEIERVWNWPRPRELDPLPCLMPSLFQSIKRRKSTSLVSFLFFFLQLLMLCLERKRHPATFLLIGTRLKPSVGWPPVWYLTRKFRFPGQQTGVKWLNAPPQRMHGWIQIDGMPHMWNDFLNNSM